ncbi:MAG: hypothetical protein K2N63_14345 [Lachnospiraceae bacterium]|nr:hypothetical protein [Lachnospiraceae bacterium]
MKQFDRRLRPTGNGNKKDKRKLGLLLGFAVAALGILGIILFGRGRNKAYDSYEILNQAELGEDRTIRYQAYDGGYISYGRDGAAAFNAQGGQRWNIAYTMKNPVVAVCSTYAVVADRGGKQFYIVDGQGTSSHFELAEKIAVVSIASQGVTAVMATGDERDHIYLYEPGSQGVLVDIMTVTKNNGFPLAIALSQDGRKLVTSYVSFDGGTCLSWVTFYNFGEVGQNYVDNMVGSYSFEELVPELAFVTNDTAMVCRESGVVFYRITEVPKVMAKEDFTESIQSVFYSKTHTGLVLGAARDSGGRLVMYRNDGGKKVLDMEFSSGYRGIYTSGEDIVCYDSGEMTIYNLSGKQKFHCETEKNINAVFRVDDETRYILIGNETADTIRLKREE